jgi:hypothetical protein
MTFDFRIAPHYVPSSSFWGLLSSLIVGVLREVDHQMCDAWSVLAVGYLSAFDEYAITTIPRSCDTSNATSEAEV